MKYIIVDDEHYAHDVIKGYCEQMEHLQFVKSCYDAIEALNILKSEQVDLIFLDLNMPKISGFDFLKTLSKPPKVIVTTAYKEFAVEGYELDIVDYLLKPVSFERFIKAINKIDSVDANKAMSRSVLSNDREDENRIFLRSNKSYIQVDLKTILFVESTGNYCKVVTLDSEIVIRDKISNVIKTLPSDNFFQVHKSFIVSKSQINSIEGNRIMIRNYEVPIGKSFKLNVNRILSGS
ncbi:LytR/AlgR family response regulator transcription factor [Fulvivirga sedimenti]|uniref:Response regulator transcription factor n=1 Tax=Fulvivirga sedimenti TaxID=2879465 RepID=A0A9X1HV64_9BACT|nr:response regulator transcription factor [Fulvivirga sedimenti]MCA6074472.1 response regulator transcription factor [Fulvivirga sedimenti]MCA6075649.1 response regulator transcription factor [Fulvivirga sedimenti]MCA6076777.1 response regulator transcription factor [Fulvivirga sedimenti]